KPPLGSECRDIRSDRRPLLVGEDPEVADVELWSQWAGGSSNSLSVLDAATPTGRKIQALHGLPANRQARCEASILEVGDPVAIFHPDAALQIDVCDRREPHLAPQGAVVLLVL